MASAPPRLDRRTLLMGAAGAGVAITASALWLKVAAGQSGGASEDQRRLLVRVADLTIPATDTAGAVAVGVPAWVELALAHGIDGTSSPGPSSIVTGSLPKEKASGGLGWLDALAAELDGHSGGSFVSAPAKAQQRALASLDAAALAPGAPASAWAKIKGLIVTGYYTSEVGGSKELRYQLVPGRWDADVPANETTRAFSSDWTAVEFG